MYGLSLWGDDNFKIKNGHLHVDYKSAPSLLSIIKQIRNRDIRGPILLRFPHLIHKQIDSLFTHFNRAIQENHYPANFFAVFPLKVNQFPGFVYNLLEQSEGLHYGLEAGSKAELVLAMALNPKDAPLTVNGFKDKEMITLGFLARQMGHNITLTIEGLTELEMIIEVAKEMPEAIPNIGIRMRLHSGGSGNWAKSGGMDAKFGLTSTELLEAIDLLREEKMLESLHMLHFHIGSQMSDINPLKKALREVGNIYTDLIKMGASKLRAINIGGGLAIEYSQSKHAKNRNYTLAEFSNDVVFTLKSITQNKNVPSPDIYTESGRFIAAPHAMLISPVLELFSHDYQEKSIKLKEQNPPLVMELYDLLSTLTPRNATEFVHDAIDHLESLLTLFDLGYIDLIDRSNAEVITHLIIKKALPLMVHAPTEELMMLQQKLQERYLVNSSFFQSIPDFWGLQQHFPVMPIHYLDKKALRPATLWDISCDSDGEIPFDDKAPLFLHDINLDEEEYFLGFFLLGAYQEVLGMNHNLFTHPTQVVVAIDDESFSFTEIQESDTIVNILSDIGYDGRNIEAVLKEKINTTPLLNATQKRDTLTKISLLLTQNGYLRTTN
ncbi:MAG: arginine decarboxylase [Sulfuricurvum sp. PC08-66]|nr:MAG: arginine decarboxylase [Sulfuricurvum sp. PC08-66]